MVGEASEIASCTIVHLSGSPKPRTFHDITKIFLKDSFILVGFAPPQLHWQCCSPDLLHRRACEGPELGLIFFIWSLLCTLPPEISRPRSKAGVSSEGP